MIKHSIEHFFIRNCPYCKKNHPLRIQVFRDYLPNHPENDIRVPEHKQINLRIVCPKTTEVFNRDFFLNEDRFSRIVKLRRPD